MVDPDFFPVIGTFPRSAVENILIEPNGKIILGTAGLIRLLPDGTRDATFTAPSFSGGSPAPRIFALARQGDGKIVVGGSFGFVNGQPRERIARLNADGSLDTTFTWGFLCCGVSVKALALQPDGRILVAASNGFIGFLTRLDTNGFPDPSFQNTLPGSVDFLEMALQSDGRFVLAYRVDEMGWKTKVGRFNANGTQDMSFNVVNVVGTGGISTGSPDIQALYVSPTGQVLIGGSLTTVSGVPRSRIARIDTDGSLDESYLPAFDEAVGVIQPQSDGRIIVGGRFTSVNGSPRMRMALLNHDGSLDGSFSPSVRGADGEGVSTVAIQADGRILIGGRFRKIDESLRYGIGRLATDGSLDPTFPFLLNNSNGTADRLAVSADGKIYVGGEYADVNGEDWLRFSRLNSNGSTDADFVNPGPFPGVTSVSAILPVAENKVVIGGQFTPIPIRRYNEDGTLDTNFLTPFTSANSHSIRALLQQPDGKILAGGTFAVSGIVRKNNLVRLNSDGSLDPTFLNALSGANLPVSQIAIQNDGKIIITGEFTEVNGVTRNRVARLNADGSLDTTFQNEMAGISNSTNTANVNVLKLLPDGKIFIGGNFETVNGTERRFLARLNADGSLDTNFLNGLAGPQAAVNALVVQGSKIIIGGSFFSVNGIGRKAIARLNSDGTVDQSFSILFSSPSPMVNALVAENDGNVLVGLGPNVGATVNGLTRTAVFRILSGSGTTFDYDGDGKSDVSIFRPSTGLWYLLRSTAGYTGMQWGEGTDKITPADYDGDGKTDVAVFRASNSTWYIFNSATQTFSTENWGQAGDLAVPADYDGDGRADVSVYRPSDANWYRKLSGGGFSFVNFGTAEDKPVPSDYDGDGRADIGVFRPSTGIWYFLRTTAGFTGIQWGVGTDIQAPGDYDGDGKTDVAVFRPENGTWYMGMSTAGFASVAWGQSGDIPSAGDFDGDGKTDVAVFRPSNGHWYILNSTAGIADYHFGESGDQPTESAFRY